MRRVWRGMTARLALIFTLYSYLREEPAHGPCLLLLLRRELVEDLLQRRLAHAILLPPTRALGEPRPTGEREGGGLRTWMERRRLLASNLPKT